MIYIQRDKHQQTEIERTETEDTNREKNHNKLDDLQLQSLPSFLLQDGGNTDVFRVLRAVHGEAASPCRPAPLRPLLLSPLRRFSGEERMCGVSQLQDGPEG